MNGQVWGNAYSYNVLYVHLLRNYGGQSFHASLIGSLIFGIVMFLPIVVSPLMMRLSLRWLYVAACVIGGLGPALSSFVNDLRLWYVTFVLPIGMSGATFFCLGFCVAAKLFPKHAAIVCSLVSGSTGLFTLCLPSLWEVSMAYLGFRNTLYAYSGFYGLLLTVTFALPLRYSSKEEQEEEEKKEEAELEEVEVLGSTFAPFASAEIFVSITSLRQETQRLERIQRRCGEQLRRTICQRSVLLWTVANIIACVMLYSPFVHIMKLAKQVVFFNPARPPPPDFPKTALITAVSVAISLGSIISKVIFAFLCQWRVLRPLLLFQAGLALFGVAQTSMALVQLIDSSSFYSIFCIFVFLAFCIGAGEGPYFALLLPVTNEVAGPRSDPTIFSFVCSAIAFPLIMGGPIGERLFHLTGDYLLTFLVGGLVFLTAALLLFFIPASHGQGEEFELVAAEDKTCASAADEIL